MAKVNNNSGLRTSKIKSITKTKSFRKINSAILRLNSATRKEIENSFITQICSAKSQKNDSDKDPNNSSFLLAASQINTDLTVAAQCEFEEDLSIDDPNQGFFDLHRSVAYWELRNSFIEDAINGSEYSFMTAVWRAYNAGRLSPDRLVPDTQKVRDERSAAGATNGE